MILFGNKVVTLYNKYFDVNDEIEEWHATVLSNVNLQMTQGANIAKNGIENADKAKLLLDENATEKEYVKPKAWRDLEDKSDAYTFGNEDFFVLGDTSSEEELENGFFEYMLNKYDDVFRVTTVDIYSDIMPHIEVGGK